MGVVQMNSNPLAKDFNTGSLLKFAFPTISMMLFMGLYTIVDTIFVSRFVNTNALSAINIVCPVINLIVGLGTMIATGGSAIVARKMGAGEPKRAKQDFTLLILFGFILGVPELFMLNKPELKRNYVSAIKDTVLLRDIIQRYNVRDAKLLDMTCMSC